MSEDLDQETHENSPVPASDELQRAFTRLWFEHAPQVRLSLRGLLPTWHDVDDVLQETGLVAWRKFRQYKEGTMFGGWLKTIARFEAYSHRRRLTQTPRACSNEFWDLKAKEPDGAETYEVHRRHLDSCLAIMPPEERELLLKVHSRGIVIRELASQSGKSEHAFYKAVQRLRADLIKRVSRSIATANAELRR